MGIYRSLKAKGIIPIIPLDEASAPKPSKTTTTSTTTTTSETKKKKTPVTPRPQVEMYPDITFDPDGTPLCPGGCRMRHATSLKAKAAHIFACPCIRKNKAGDWVFHAGECAFQKDGTPKEKKMGHTLSIKSCVNHDCWLT